MIPKEEGTSDWGGGLEVEQGSREGREGGRGEDESPFEKHCFTSWLCVSG